MARGLPNGGVIFQMAVGLITPLGAYLIATNRAPWVVLVVLALLTLNALANGVSLAREANAANVGGKETRYAIVLRTIAGLSVIAAGIFAIQFA